MVSWRKKEKEIIFPALFHPFGGNRPHINIIADYPFCHPCPQSISKISFSLYYLLKQMQLLNCLRPECVDIFDAAWSNRKFPWAEGICLLKLTFNHKQTRKTLLNMRNLVLQMVTWKAYVQMLEPNLVFINNFLSIYSLCGLKHNLDSIEMLLVEV